MRFLKQLWEKTFKYLPFIVVLLFSLIVFAVSIRMTYSRYSNFENGKFDLGNMAQMVWNSMNGRFMYVTDYFGTNMPRWGMSHVDPFLLVFIPFMYVFKTPLVLVFGQLFLVIFSSLILYKIGELELKNKWASAAIAIAYLWYPANGYILAWTDYHGVTAVMPFFFLAFYIYEKMHKEQNYSKKNYVYLWISLVLAMSGKEEIPLFVFMLGFFILFWRNNFSSLVLGISKKTVSIKQALIKFLTTRDAKIGLTMMIVGFVWFYYAFFILIPNSAHYRIEGYKRFVESVGVTPDETVNVDNENYFLLRYEEFGSSYGEIVLNMILHPSRVIAAWTDGSKPEYFKQTMLPVLYLPLIYPPIFAISIPEFIINYTSTSGGVSTANIENHRISLIVVVLFIAVVYAISFISRFLKEYFKVNESYVIYFLAILLLVVNIEKSFEYKNPIYLWIQQAIERRVMTFVKAEENVINDDRAFSDKIKEGDQLKLVRLETKDRDCAQYIMSYIPDEASVSGPDYMGAKLSLRETYALFPALFQEADYIIADIYSRKVSRVLGIPSIILNSKVGDVMMDPNYHLRFVCGNLALFERNDVVVDMSPKELPIQQVFQMKVSKNYEIDRGLYLRDFTFPSEINREEFYKANFVYERKESKSLNDHKLFLTFVHMDKNEYFQIPHLASYAMSPLDDFDFNRYYTEEVEIMLPAFLEDGNYRVFLGLTNGIDTQSIYLSDLKVK